MLEIAGVLRGFSVDDTRVRGRGQIGGAGSFDEVLEDGADGFGEGIEADGVFDDLLSGGAVERLVVGEEISVTGEIALGAFVVATHDGVIRTLEELAFAIVDELERGRAVGRGFR